MDNKKGIGIVLAAITIASIFAMIAPTAVAEGTESEADKMLSKMDARNLVISQVLNGNTEGKLVYVSSEPVKAGTIIESWYSSIELPQKEGWFFFVDDHPSANWEHPCRYVFVDLTGKMTVYKATTPPNNIMELEGMVGFKTVGFKAGKKPETYTNPLPLKSLQTASNQVTENCYAVIISGGANPASNYWRYWNDSSFIYTTLTQVYGYADDHIYVLMSDGTDPGDDRHCQIRDATGVIIADWLDSSPLDLDGDGDNDIDYAATRTSITTVFDTLSGILGEGDYLFVFTTDHGAPDPSAGATPQDVILHLWGETIRDDEFATELNKISADCEAIMIMMEQCNSGGFVDDLIPGPQDRVIATACSSTESSWAMTPYCYYDEFSYHWTCAVAWQDPEGVSVDADSDNNGQVSMEEAFDYAESHDTAAETPQYSEDPAGIGSDIYLCLCWNSIDKGLKWLRTHQNPSGSWSNDVGITSLAALAFLNAGYNETDSDVQDAIGYILSKVHGDGSIYSSSSYKTYQTSLAILPLVATHNNSYNTTIENAAQWLNDTQWDESCKGGTVNKDNWYYGGFGYHENTRPDLSNTQFPLMALDAVLNFSKDDLLWDKAQVFLARDQMRQENVTIPDLGYEVVWNPSYNKNNDGGFVYYPGVSLSGTGTSYGGMTAAGIWSLRLCNVPTADPRVQAALDWHKGHYTWTQNPGMTPDGRRFQYYYYLAFSKALMMTVGNQTFDGHDWYADLSANLTGLQHADGHWVNTYTGHGGEGSPELCTAYSILSLQVREIPTDIKRLSWMTLILNSSADLHIYDPLGRHVGKNYETGGIDLEIPNATYTSNDVQNITFPELEVGNYRIVLIGTETGEYTITVTGGVGDTVVSEDSYTGNITKGEVHDSTVNVAMITWLTIHVEEPEEIDTMVQAATGTGPVYFILEASEIEDLIALNESDLPEENLIVEFPHGLFGFNITGLTPGQNVTLIITFPSDIPTTSQYWKYGPNGSINNPQPERWYQIPMGSNDGDNIITIKLTDGGVGDDDGVANGVIVDQGGPGIPTGVARVPTLTPIGIIALVGLLTIVAVGRIRKKK